MQNHKSIDKKLPKSYWKLKKKIKKFDNKFLFKVLKSSALQCNSYLDFFDFITFFPVFLLLLLNFFLIYRWFKTLLPVIARYLKFHQGSRPVSHC